MSDTTATEAAAPRDIEHLDMTDDARARALDDFLPHLADDASKARPARVLRFHFTSTESAILAAERIARAEPKGTYTAPGHQGQDLEDSLHVARNGDRRATEAARRIRDRITAQAPTRQRLTGYAVAGAHPSVPRFLSGLPDCMHARRPTPTARIITLVMNACTGNSAATTAIAGGCAALIDAIEATGTRVRFIFLNRSNSSKTGPYVASDVAYLVKEPDQPADLARLALWAGHEATYQGISWAIKTGSKSVRAMGGSLGGRPGLAHASDPARHVYALPYATGAMTTNASPDEIGLRWIRAAVAGLARDGIAVDLAL